MTLAAMILVRVSECSDDNCNISVVICCKMFAVHCTPVE